MDAWGLTQELNGEGLTIKQHSLIPESKLRDDRIHSKIRSVKKEKKKKRQTGKRKDEATRKPNYFRRHPSAVVTSRMLTSHQMDGSCEQTTAATMSLDEDVKDVKINPDWGEFGWWKHMGGCMDVLFCFFFRCVLTVVMPHLASS